MDVYYYCIMSTTQKPQNIYQQKCNRLLQEEEIRFAGIINEMGCLVSGDFKKGIIPLEDEADRQKMYMELVLRVSTRAEFDDSLGPVLFSASRRKNTVMMSFPLKNKVLMISAEISVDIEKLAKKVLKIIEL